MVPAAEPGSDPEIEVSVVMPCLNEADTLADCIRTARATLAEASIAGEIIVADNGSDDESRQIALREGASVVPVSETPVSVVPVSAAASVMLSTAESTASSVESTAASKVSRVPESVVPVPQQQQSEMETTPDHPSATSAQRIMMPSF